MVDKSKEIKVSNRSDSQVGYLIPDLGNAHDIRRQFAPRESKMITFEELEALSWVPGGDVLLKNYLVIWDKEALEALVPDAQPEYYFTKEDVTKLIQTGTMDQFLDCLDFAPEGVLEMVKDLSVSLPLTDTEKIRAIQRKLNFDVQRAIEIEEYRNEKPDVDDNVAAAPKEEKARPSERRAAPINELSTHKYKVVEG